MLNKKISLLAMILISSSLVVACGKKEEAPVKEEPPVAQKAPVKEEQPKEISLNKVTFKDHNELKSFAKTQLKTFENVLKNNRIDVVSSPDSTLVVNKNMTYEKYTKEFNQLAYAHISKDYETGIGYLKGGIKYNVHMQEQVSIENNFIKAMLDTIKVYNPNIDEEKFNTDIKNATGDPNSISDTNIETGVKGITLKVYANPDTNEREIALSIRQDIEFPKLKSLLKQYKTVKEFKEDTTKLQENLNQKISRINEVLKNTYIGKFKDLELLMPSYSPNFEQFNQSVELEYRGTQITGLQDEFLEGLYEIICDVLTKEQVSKIISLEDFKAYFKSLEVYAGAFTTGSVIDEMGEAIAPNKLPFLSEVELSMSFKHSNGTNSIPEGGIEDKNENAIKLYDAKISVKINIPVKAEGVTSL